MGAPSVIPYSLDLTSQINGSSVRNTQIQFTPQKMPFPFREYAGELHIFSIRRNNRVNNTGHTSSARKLHFHSSIAPSYYGPILHHDLRFQAIH